MNFPDYMTAEDIREFEAEWDRLAEQDWEQWVREMEEAAFVEEVRVINAELRLIAAGE